MGRVVIQRSPARPAAAPMKLKSFRSRTTRSLTIPGRSRSILNLTALVGRNESGKTAILKALWKSRNVADATFDKLYDFPRDRYPKERSGNQVVTVLEFGLSDQEAMALAELLPSRPGQRPTKITRITRYEGQSGIGSEIIFESSAVETLTGRDAAAAIEASHEIVGRARLRRCGAIDQAAFSAVQQIDPALPVWTEQNVAALESYAAVVTNWVNADQAEAKLGFGRKGWPCRPCSPWRSKVTRPLGLGPGQKRTCRPSSITMTTAGWRP